jgi:hypothetical protein
MTDTTFYLSEVREKIATAEDWRTLDSIRTQEKTTMDLTAGPGPCRRTVTKEGWVLPHAACKKAHFIRHGISLCGRWGFLGHAGMDPRISPTPGPDDCKACWRKRDAERNSETTMQVDRTQALIIIAQTLAAARWGAPLGIAAPVICKALDDAFDLLDDLEAEAWPIARAEIERRVWPATAARRRVLAKINTSDATKDSPLRLHGADFRAARWLCDNSFARSVGTGFYPIGGGS